jgi:hypothetical protein
MRNLPYNVQKGLQRDISGSRDPIEHFTAADTLTNNETGKICTNLGAVGAVIISLPTSAKKGMKFTFAVMAAQTFSINPGASGGIYVGGSKLADDTDLSSSEIGEAVTLVSDDNGDWFVSGKEGQWGLGETVGAGINYGTSTGTDTIILTLAPALGAYVAGVELTFKPGGDNTGACTINVNGLGAKNIKTQTGVDPASADIDATGIAKVVYDGTNFVLLNPATTTD